MLLEFTQSRKIKLGLAGLRATTTVVSHYMLEFVQKVQPISRLLGKMSHVDSITKIILVFFQQSRKGLMIQLL